MNEPNIITLSMEIADRFDEMNRIITERGYTHCKWDYTHRTYGVTVSYPNGAVVMMVSSSCPIAALMDWVRALPPPPRWDTSMVLLSGTNGL